MLSLDDDEEMGECCGCPLSSAELATFSVEQNLTSNWGLSGGSEQGDHGNGSIAIIAASPNTTPLTPGGDDEAANCLGGACCDPPMFRDILSRWPAETISSAASRIIRRLIRLTDNLPRPNFSMIAMGRTSISSMENQCGAIVGNGTHGAICNCPIE